MYTIYYWSQILYMHVMDLLFGYPKEYSVYPIGEHKQIRHTGGLWELKPTYTYTRRALSPFKNNYRYGWEVVVAPPGYDDCVGITNLTKDPGTAIYNLLEGRKIMREFLRNRTDKLN